VSLVTLNRNPSGRELRWFGLLLGLFLAVAGHALCRRLRLPALAPGAWALAAAVTATYYALPALRRRIYLGWTYLTYPIGATVSWGVLSVVYFGVVTPVGLLLRLAGRDPLQRALERGRPSYWTDHRTGDDPRRYFRQY
jgi:hypothetical protein